MQKNHKNNLVLFGFKSVGKSLFGKLISSKLQKYFIDTDKLIEDRYRMQYKKTLGFREIYKKIGHEAFRELERMAVSSLEHVEDTIIAIGGGTLLNPDNCSTLKKIGMLVYLEVEKETLKERILKGEPPSFLDKSNLEQSFEKIYHERATIFESVHHFKVNLNNKSQEEIVTEIIKKMGRR